MKLNKSGCFCNHYVETRSNTLIMSDYSREKKNKSKFKYFSSGVLPK